MVYLREAVMLHWIVSLRCTETFNVCLYVCDVFNVEQQIKAAGSSLMLKYVETKLLSDLPSAFPWKSC